jgi:AraC-like DNA-binding protein
MTTVDPLSETRNTVWRLEPLRRRESYEGRSALLQEVPLIGQLALHQTVPCALPGHRHAGIIEIHFVRKGSLSLWVDARDRIYTVRCGQSFLTLPGQLHGGVGGLINRALFSWLQVRTPARTGRPLPGLSVSQTRSLLQPFTASDAPPVFMHSAATATCFERLIAEHSLRRPDSAIMARTLLHELLALLGRDYREARMRPKANETGFSAPVRNALRWLKANPEGRAVVAHMAQASGLSERHFRSRFFQETGFTPSDYAACGLVERARELLRQSERKVTDIAHELGFSTSAYFAAFFRRYTGQTPSECRSDVKRCES